MATKRVKSLLFGAFLGVLLFAGLFFNIVVHESGHYAAASDLNLKPQMHFFADYKQPYKVSLFTPNFFTLYEPHSSAKQDAEIALAGPMTNALIAACLIGVYIALPKNKKTFRLNLIFLVLIVPAVVSAFSNMLPLAGTDGSVIWNYLFG
ncbi:MAG: site-2 protease family protein [archaeon]